MLTELGLRSALNRAFNLGQAFWCQADSDNYLQSRKAYDTKAKFRAMVEETVAAFGSTAGVALPAPARLLTHDERTRLWGEHLAKPLWQQDHITDVQREFARVNGITLGVPVDASVKSPKCADCAQPPQCRMYGCLAGYLGVSEQWGGKP